MNLPVMSLRLFALFAASALAACGQPSDSAGETASAAESRGAVAAPSDLILPAAQRAMLVADGIVYRGSDETPVQKLSFGDSEQDATGKLVTITSESTEYFDPDAAGCSTTTFGASAGYFQAGKFVGFSTSAANLKTDKGIGIGSTRAALAAAYDPEFQSGSDGVTTFTSASLTGILQGENEEATVSDISIGHACE